MKNYKIMSYALMDGGKRDPFLPIVLERIIGFGVNSWRIYDGTTVLSKIPDERGFFCFYMTRQPSGCDKAYYKQYRFDTAEEAARFWEENRGKIVATGDERRAYYDLVSGEANK